MSFLQGLLGPPNVEKLKARGDVWRLVNALHYQNDDSVSRNAAQALVEIGEPAVQPLIACLWNRDQSHLAVELLAEIGEPAIEPLIAALKKAFRPHERVAIIKALAEIGPPAVLPLIAVLKNGWVTERQNAARALGQIGDERAIAPLVAALKDEDVDYLATKALKQIGGTQAVDALSAPGVLPGESETARIERWLRLNQGKMCRYVFVRQTTYGDYDERGEGESMHTGRIRRTLNADKEHYQAYGVGDAVLSVLKTPTDLGDVQILEQSEQVTSWREVYNWGSVETKTVEML